MMIVHQEFIEKKEKYSKQIITKRKQKAGIIIPMLDKIEFKKNC